MKPITWVVFTSVLAVYFLNYFVLNAQNYSETDVQRLILIAEQAVTKKNFHKAISIFNDLIEFQKRHVSGDVLGPMQLLQKAFAEYNVNEWEQVIESLAALQNHRIPREKELLAKKMLAHSLIKIEKFAEASSIIEEIKSIEDSKMPSIDFLPDITSKSLHDLILKAGK
ncbi:MAG: hypothetical protein KA152_16660 [Verrucomicrobiales bacterium]|nr:hypothetical protein [Verrucomicrobiales bacterium]HQW29732.1 hypothetical protein [Verrucomicrobiales bacterium]